MKRYGRILSLALVTMMVFTILAGCGGSSTANKDTGSQQSSATEAEKSTAPAGSTAAEVTATPAPESNTYPENGLPKDQKVTLKVGFYEAGYGRAYLDYALESFSKKFPNVKFEVKASPRIGTTIETLVQSKKDDQMFDIMQYYGDYAQNGLLEPLDDVLDRKLYDTPDKTLKQIGFNGFFDGLTHENDGHLYSIPHAMGIGGLYYDKKFFKENGWNEDPKTYDEFLKLCDDIKAKGIVPIVFAGIYNYNEYMLGDSQTFAVAEANGNLEAYEKKYREMGTPYFDNPEQLDLLNRYMEMGKKGFFSPGSATLNHIQSQMMAVNHKAAMVCCCDWIDNEMRKESDSGKDKNVVVPDDFEWGYMAVPVSNNPDQKMWLYTFESSYFTIYKNRPDLNKKWAKEFLVWMMNLDCQKAMAQWAGALPLRQDFMDNPDNIANLRTAHQSVLAYMKAHNNNVKLENQYKTTKPKLGPSRQNANTTFTQGRVQVALGKKDPAELLKKCEQMYLKALEEGKKMK